MSQKIKALKMTSQLVIFRAFFFLHPTGPKSEKKNPENQQWNSSLALVRGRELLALLCVVAVCVLCLFLVVPWVGLQSVIVAFPVHTHFLVKWFSENKTDQAYLHFAQSLQSITRLILLFLRTWYKQLNMVICINQVGVAKASTFTCRFHDYTSKSAFL